MLILVDFKQVLIIVIFVTIKVVFVLIARLVVQGLVIGINIICYFYTRRDLNINYSC